MSADAAETAPSDPAKGWLRPRLPPLHPFLFGVAPLLALAQHNVSELDLTRLPGILFAVLLFSGVLYLLAHRWRRDRHESALLASVALVAFFYYGHAHDLLIHLGLLAPYIDGYAIAFFVVWMAAWAAALAAAVRVSLPHRKLGVVLHAVGIFLVAVALLPLGASVANGDLPGGGPGFEPEVPAATSVAARHDIFHIVLDGYGSASVLEEVYDFSNRPFLQALADQRFQVFHDGHSNYAQTRLSLASTLNMMHLHETWVNEGSGPGWVPPLDMVRNNAVLAFLNDQGYTTHHLGADWLATRENPYADHDDACKARTEFEYLFAQTTMLRILQDDLVGDERRAQILCQLDALDRLAAEEADGPTYTFAHIVSPHPPYLFDADGKAVKGGEVDLRAGWDGRPDYVKQLRFLNSRLLAFVETALDRPDPPIIILQADHGPYSIRDIELERTLWDGFDSRSFEDPLVIDAVAERMGILNAIHLPGEQAPTFAENTTPVNTYRILFDHYFGTGLGVVEDTVWFSPLYHAPAAWFDVSDLLSARTARG